MVQFLALPLPGSGGAPTYPPGVEVECRRCCAPAWSRQSACHLRMERGNTLARHPRAYTLLLLSLALYLHLCVLQTIPSTAPSQHRSTPLD
jgi:hypothetical protein